MSDDKHYMEVVDEREFEDEEGLKKARYFRSGLVEITHLEPSQKFINEQINPRIEISNRTREKEEKDLRTVAKMKEMAEKALKEENK